MNEVVNRPGVALFTFYVAAATTEQHHSAIFRRASGRMPFIRIGDAISGAPSDESVQYEQVDGGEPTTDLSILLRRAGRFRNDSGPDATSRLIGTWQEIWALEHYAIRQQVISKGYAQTGNAWVNDSDVDDVLAEVMLDATRMFLAFRGIEVGQFRAAMNKRIHWTVVNYVRKDQANKSAPVDPAAFDPNGSDETDAHHAELAGIAAKGGAGDRAMFKETLSCITELEPRAAEVVALRLTGMSSKEVAETLELTPANVDQIFSRSVTKMRKLLEDD
ncbi:MAG: sigma-70 family RNA polymerase sigma factor [Thermoleophilaceae bacterium]|nr:sigma-70 family RNA polymerase sigma factor [Thermoleophilaceae bacterium]